MATAAYYIDTIRKMFAGKTYERPNKLTKYNFHPTQFGFKKHFSATHAITANGHIIQCDLDIKHKMVLTSIDFTRALTLLRKS